MQLAFQIFYATNYSALLGYFGAYRKRHFRDTAKKLDLERENCHLPIID
jgi:hypothetical protein